MRKIIVFLVIGMSLILLLGSTGSSLKLQETECEIKPMRQNMREYTIVCASELKKLQKDVNNKLKKDWYPIGGISIVDSNSFCQAMVKSR